MKRPDVEVLVVGTPLRLTLVRCETLFTASARDICCIKDMGLTWCLDAALLVRRTAQLLITSPTTKVAGPRRRKLYLSLRLSDHVCVILGSQIVAASTRHVANEARAISKQGPSLNVEVPGSTTVPPEVDTPVVQLSG